MYQHYETRERSRLARLLAILVVLVAAVFVVMRWGEVERPVSEVDGVKQVSTVKDANLAVYDGKVWEDRFWTGMNLGATLPGHAPGELAPTREDYLRWFAQMEEMNVDVLRVYTILNPEFYDAFIEFNSTREKPLWLIQGVWSPEEELTGEDLEGRDAYTPEITEIFQGEIRDAVRVVHGDADLPERPGHASGRFRSDVSKYVLGWVVGTEWFPLAVETTDDANVGMDPYSGEYFQATTDATPFEGWLAWMLDTFAKEEMEYGWQHPVALSNWPTTDPLRHPDEANEQEDLVSVDPMHVGRGGEDHIVRAAVRDPEQRRTGELLGAVRERRRRGADLLDRLQCPRRRGPLARRAGPSGTIRARRGIGGPGVDDGPARDRRSLRGQSLRVGRTPR